MLSLLSNPFYVFKLIISSVLWVLCIRGARHNFKLELSQRPNSSQSVSVFTSFSLVNKTRDLVNTSLTPRRHGNRGQSCGALLGTNCSTCNCQVIMNRRVIMIIINRKVIVIIINRKIIMS